MKKIFSITIYMFLTWISLGAQSVDSTRSQMINPVPLGPLKMGCSSFYLSEPKAGQPPVSRDDLKGTRTADKSRFITDYLRPSSTTLTFSVTVPRDPKVYGTIAGQTLEYGAILFYPVKPSSPGENYLFPANGQSILGMLPEGAMPQMDTAGKLPLILMAHGWSADPLVHIPYIQYLVSHGYAVLGIFYGDERWNGTVAQEPLIARSLATKAGLDLLQSHGVFSKFLDFDCVGVAGVSFGGTTAFALSGGKIATQDGYLSLGDSRIKAAFTVVPYTGNPQEYLWGPQDQGIKDIRIPFFTLGSNADRVVHYPTTLRVMEKVSGVKFLGEMEGVGHGFTGEMNTLIKTLSVIFLNAYLRNDQDAKTKFLQIQGVTKAQKMHFVSWP